MSVMYDSPLITGKVVYSNPELGIPGAVIRATTATGPAGPGLLYNDWQSAADDTKLFRLLLVSGVPAGMFVYDDGSFYIPAGLADGVYPIVYRLFVDGVNLGTATATVTIGAGTVKVTTDFAGSYVVRVKVIYDNAGGYIVRNKVTSDFSGAYSIATNTVPVVVLVACGFRTSCFGF